MTAIHRLVLLAVLVVVGCRQAPLVDEQSQPVAGQLYLSSAAPSEAALRDLLAQLKSALRSDLLLRPSSLEEHFGFRIRGSVGLGLRSAKAVALPDPPKYIRAEFETYTRKGPTLSIPWYGLDDASIGEAQIVGILGGSGERRHDQSFHPVPLGYTDVYFIDGPMRLLEVRYTARGRVEEIRIRLAPGGRMAIDQPPQEQLSD